MRQLREALRAPECSEAYRYWCDFIPDLGLAEVADESLVEQLNLWYPDRGSLRDAVLSAPQDGGQALIGWLDLVRTASPAPTGGGGTADVSASPQDETTWPQQLGPWEGMPGWWIALEPQSGQWFVIESVERPVGSEESWQLSSAVLTSGHGVAGDATGAEGDTAHAWYVDSPQQVSGVEGWWAVMDPTGEWWAIQSEECPDASTQGWLRYDQAFPTIQNSPEAGQSDSLPDSPAASHQENVGKTAPQEESTEPTSPYTGRAYTDLVYAANRMKVAADLDLDNYHDLDADAKIEKLFQRFLARPFQYTMRAGGFDRFASGEGDCKTLASAFRTVASQEFNIQMDEGRVLTPFLVPFSQIIDNGSVGNCDNGTKWFFQNHYWAEYGGQAYDLLFGTQGVNLGDPSRSTGHLENPDGTASEKQWWLTEAGVLVWENNPDGPRAERYRCDETPDRSELRKAGYQVSLMVHAHWYLDTFGEDAFFDWMMSLQPEQLARLRGDERLAAVDRSVSRRRLGLDRDGGLEPDPNSVLAVRIDEQVRAIIGAVRGLAGDESDANTVDELATAMQTVMADIGAYQQLADDGPAHSLYSAGAAAAQALAEFGELPDRGSRTALLDAVGQLGEWAARVQPR